MNQTGPAAVSDELIIRPCRPDDRSDMLAIINSAAEAYRGVIPADRWHEPYMSADDLVSEIEDEVAFCGAFANKRLVGVMGVQRRVNVDLIRHAYVDPDWQGRGVGAALLLHLSGATRRPILVGTWRAAEWAIRFYERHGFGRVQDGEIAPLLRCYWNVPDRQVATSVVLAAPHLKGGEAEQLIAHAR